MIYHTPTSFWYLQMRSYIQNSKVGRKTSGDLHPLVKYLEKNYNNIGIPHQISAIHDILENSHKQQDTRAKLKWEEELNFHVSDDTWKEMNRNVHTTTASPYWREYAWKIQARYFIMSVQQVKYNNKIWSNCWRECGAPHDNLSHVLWFCPSLQLFWNNIQKEFNTIFNCDIHLNTGFVLLGKTVDEIQNENDKYLLRILHIAALKQITRNWLQRTCPSIVKWKETVQQIYQMKELTHKIRGNLKLFENRWSKSLYYHMVEA